MLYSLSGCTGEALHVLGEREGKDDAGGSRAAQQPVFSGFSYNDTKELGS